MQAQSFLRRICLVKNYFFDGALVAALGIIRHTVTVWLVRKEIVWKYANPGIKCCAKNSGSDDDRGPFGHGYSIGSICNE